MPRLNEGGSTVGTIRPPSPPIGEGAPIEPKPRGVLYDTGQPTDRPMDVRLEPRPAQPLSRYQEVDAAQRMYNLVQRGQYNYLHQELNRRVTAFPDFLIRDAPHDVASLLFSHIDTVSLSLIGEGLTRAYPWLQTTGINRQITNAYAKALQIGDPAIRDYALSLVNQFARSGKVRPGIQGEGHVLYARGKGDIHLFLDAAKSNIGVDTTDTSAGVGGVPDSALVQYLFGNLPLQFENTQTTGGVVGGLVGGGAHVLGAGLSLPFQALAKVPFAPESVKRGLTEGVNTVIGRATDVLFGGAAAIAAQGSPLGKDAFRKYAWPEQPGAGIGAYVNDALGVKKTDPNYEKISEASTLIAQWILLDAAGGMLKGFREAGRTAEVNFTPERIAYMQKHLGALGEVVYQLRNKGVAGFPETAAGERFFDAIERMNKKYGDEAAGRIRQRFTLPDAPAGEGLADWMAGLSREEAVVAWKRWSNGEPKFSDVKAWAERRNQIDADLPAAMGMQRTNLLAERQRLQYKMSTPVEHPPILQYPRVRLRDALNVSNNRFAKFVAGEYSGFFDQFTRNDRLYNQFRSDAPRNAMNLTREAVLRTARYLQVDRDMVADLLDRYGKVRDSGEFYEWVNQAFDTFKQGKAVRRSDFIEARFKSSSDPAQATRSMLMRTDADGIVHSDPVLSYVNERGIPTAIPSIEAELVDHVTLPSVRDLVLARKFSNGLIERARATKRPLRSVEGALDDVAGLGTSLFKPLILDSEIPRLSIRIQAEQMLRAWEFGIPLIRTIGARARRGIPDFQDAEIGLIVEGMNKRPVYYEQPLWDKNGKPVTDPKAYANSIGWQFPKWNTSPSIRELLSRGEEGFTRWVMSDELDAQVVRREIGRLIDDPRVNIYKDIAARGEAVTQEALFREWAKRQMEVIDQHVGGVKELRALILTRKARIPLFEEPTKVRFPSRYAPSEKGRAETLESARIRYADVRGQYDLYTEVHIPAAERALQRARLDGTNDEWLAARENLKEVKDQALALERQIVKKYYNVSLDKPEQLGRVLAHLAETEQYVPPARVGARKLDIANIEGEARRLTATVSNIMYSPLKLMSALDKRLTRGTAYDALAYGEYTHFKGLGLSDKSAKEWAHVVAAQKTADLMYDLSARTPMQSRLRNHSYFLPAFQEILTTWLVKAPSQYYLPFGAVILYEKGHLISEALHQFGVIQKGPDGEDRILIPFLGKLLPYTGFLKTLEPGQVKDIFSLNPKGLNLVFSGFPGLSTQDEVFFNLAAKAGWVPKWLNHLVTPYDNETSFGPAALTFLYEVITGEPPSWEFASKEWQQDNYDRGMDHAAAQAIAELYKDGIKPPTAKQFPGAAKDNAVAERYAAALEQYRKEVQKRTESIFRGWALIRLLGASTLPATTRVTDNYGESYQLMYDRMHGKEPPRNSPLHEAWLKNWYNTLDQWLGDHPGSFGYAQAVTKLTGKASPDVVFAKHDEKYYEKWKDGLLEALPPDEFIRATLYAESERTHYARLHAIQEEMGGTASAILLNYGKYRQAVDAEYNAWDAYNARIDPDAAAEYRKRRQLAGYRDSLSYATEQKFNAARQMRDLAYRLDSSVDIGDWKKIYHAILDDALKGLKESGSSDPVAAGLSWYMDGPLSKYLAEIGAHYDKARTLRASGDSLGASAEYEAARAVSIRWQGDIAHGGEKFPSPEDFLWNALSPSDQEARVRDYRARPVAWLSPFQRQKAGYPDAPGADDFFTKAAQFDQTLQQRIVEYEAAQRRAGQPISSKYLDSLQQWRDATLAAEAQRAGPEIAQMWQLSEAPAADRILAVGLGDVDPGAADLFKQTVEAAHMVADRLKGGGVSASGWSTDAVYYKSWLFSIVDSLRAKNPAYDSFLDDLATSLPVNGTPRGGPALYNALFFAGFSPVPDYFAAYQGAA